MKWLNKLLYRMDTNALSEVNKHIDSLGVYNYITHNYDKPYPPQLLCYLWLSFRINYSKDFRKRVEDE